MQRQVQAALGGTDPAAGREEIVAANSPVRGSPDAPVTIVEYADFQCPFCSKAEYSIAQVLREYPGKVKLVFKNFPLDFHENAMPAARAALAAGEQGKFWEMHDLIFSHQSSIKQDDLSQMAKGLGLDVDRFTRDLDSQKVKTEIDAELAEGRKRGVNGTPTFYVDGQEMVGALGASQFEAMIDRSLRAKDIEPARVPMEADGGPARGPEHAPVTVLWYSDVTSPLAVGASHLIDEVLAAYPSDVRVIFKNRPLEFHHDAELAHEALMAAAAQGKFWALHRVLLEHQSALAANDLMDYAGKAGLDTQKFYTDLTGGAFRDQVQRDVTQARESGINGVPVFFVNGKRLDGVQTLAGFKAVLDEQIQHGRVAAGRVAAVGE
jgi:protein-disulfide isomerase